MDFLDEAWRVLKPDHTLFLVVPVLEFSTWDHKSFFGLMTLDCLWDEEGRWYHNRKWKWTYKQKWITQSNGYDVVNIKVGALK